MKKLIKDNQEQEKGVKLRSAYYHTGVSMNRNTTHSKSFRKTQKALSKV